MSGARNLREKNNLQRQSSVTCPPPSRLLGGPAGNYTRIKPYRVMWKGRLINLGREGKPGLENDHGQGMELALPIKIEESHCKKPKPDGNGRVSQARYLTSLCLCFQISHEDNKSIFFTQRGWLL